jgi:hypothetical protein
MYNKIEFHKKHHDSKRYHTRINGIFLQKQKHYNNFKTLKMIQNPWRPWAIVTYFCVKNDTNACFCSSPCLLDKHDPKCQFFAETQNRPKSIKTMGYSPCLFQFLIYISKITQVAIEFRALWLVEKLRHDSRRLAAR